MAQRFQWIALKLAAACTAVFLAAYAFPGINAVFMLDRGLVLSEPWRLLSHIFLHGGFAHLYFNMFALVVFGSVFEKQAGTRNFLLAFFLGGLAAGIAGSIFYDRAVGASGAIFSVLGAMAAFRPRTVVWAWGVPMPVVVAFAAWAAADLAGLSFSDNIAHYSHLAGMLYGGLFGFWLRREMPEKRKPGTKTSGMPSEREIDDWERRWMVRGGNVYKPFASIS